MYRAQSIGSLAFAMMLAGVGSVASAESASAHQVQSFKKRQSSACRYDFFSSHSLASTEKAYGPCSGHAWVRVMRANGILMDWRHAPTYEEIYVPTNDIAYSQHKTQSSEDPVTHGH